MKVLMLYKQSFQTIFVAQSVFFLYDVTFEIAMCMILITNKGVLQKFYIIVILFMCVVNAMFIIIRRICRILNDQNDFPWKKCINLNKIYSP